MSGVAHATPPNSSSYAEEGLGQDVNTYGSDDHDPEGVNATWRDDDDDVALSTSRPKVSEENESEYDPRGRGSFDVESPGRDTTTSYVVPYPALKSEQTTTSQYAEATEQTETSFTGPTFDSEASAHESEFDSFDPEGGLADDYKSAAPVFDAAETSYVPSVSYTAQKPPSAPPRSYSSYAPPSSVDQTGPSAAASYNSYAPNVNATSYDSYRVPSPPKRQITDSPSPSIPSIYGPSSASSYALPSKPLSLNLDPSAYASSAYAPYQPAADLSPPASSAYQPMSVPQHPPSIYTTSPSQSAMHSLPPTASSSGPPTQSRAIYAPSPSQSAADDPRSTARIPIFHFGFGGKVVACFHSQLDVAPGFDVSLTGRRAAPLTIRSLKSITSESTLEPSTAEFPGPLFSGPSAAPTIALTRATGTTSSATKSKKAVVVKYLTERAVELEKGLGYLSSNKDAAEKRSTEGRSILLRLLAVMVENDGKLSGS